MPGINFILATWYTREELAKRVAIFFGSASIAGAFSGILAFGITKLGGRHGIEGWRRVFSDLGYEVKSFTLTAMFTVSGGSSSLRVPSRPGSGFCAPSSSSPTPPLLESGSPKTSEGSYSCVRNTPSKEERLPGAPPTRAV
jgi:hypothetical protein